MICTKWLNLSSTGPIFFSWRQSPLWLKKKEKKVQQETCFEFNWITTGGKYRRDEITDGVWIPHGTRAASCHTFILQNLTPWHRWTPSWRDPLSHSSPQPREHFSLDYCMWLGAIRALSSSPGSVSDVFISVWLLSGELAVWEAVDWC